MSAHRTGDVALKPCAQPNRSLTDRALIFVWGKLVEHHWLTVVLPIVLAATAIYGGWTGFRLLRDFSGAILTWAGKDAARMALFLAGCIAVSSMGFVIKKIARVAFGVFVASFALFSLACGAALHTDSPLGAFLWFLGGLLFLQRGAEDAYEGGKKAWQSWRAFNGPLEESRRSLRNARRRKAILLSSNSDPLENRQWLLEQVRAFEERRGQAEEIVNDITAWRSQGLLPEGTAEAEQGHRNEKRARDIIAFVDMGVAELKEHIEQNEENASARLSAVMAAHREEQDALERVPGVARAPRKTLQERLKESAAEDAQLPEDEKSTDPYLGSGSHRLNPP